MGKTNTDLVKHAEKALKESWYYLWGAYGQKATQAYIDSNIKQYPDNAKWRVYVSAAVGKNRVCDCYGFVKGFLWWTDDSGNPKYSAAQDRNTLAAYNAAKEKGLLANMPEIPGLVLYMTGHVGVYCGGGRFIECAGGGKGAVEGRIVGGKVTQGSRFTHWFKDVNVEYSIGGGGNSANNTVNVSVNPDNPAKVIWDYFKGKGLTDFAIAGIMGNLYVESGFKATNLQNSYEKALGYTDVTYTAAVDSGGYKNFVNDKAGYGLAQWTYWTLKQGLLDFAKSKGKSIGDFGMQLDFLWGELQGLLPQFKVANSVRAASDIMLLQYERPAEQGENARAQRASYGQSYYNLYASKGYPVSPKNIQAMVELGVISSPDYWTKVNGIEYLDALLSNAVKEGLLDKGNNRGIKDFDTALKRLVECKIISSPDYWRNLVQAGVVEYLGALLVNIANKT